VAAMNANRWDDGTALRRLVNADTRIDPQRVADIDIPLDEAVLAAA
jgi:hypothetical protein